MTDHHDLTDAQWALIAPLRLSKPHGVSRVDDRRVIGDIFYIFNILRTGAPWRDLPEQ